MLMAVKGEKLHLLEPYGFWIWSHIAPMHISSAILALNGDPQCYIHGDKFNQAYFPIWELEHMLSSLIIISLSSFSSVFLFSKYQCDRSQLITIHNSL